MSRLLLLLCLVACDAAPSATAAPPPPDIAHRVTLGVASYQPRGASFFGVHWRLSDGQELYVPIAVDVGCTITGWTLGVQKGTAASQFTGALQYVEPGTSAVYVVDGQAALGLYGAIVLQSGALEHVVMPGADYAIRVARDYVASTDYVQAAELMYACPAG